MDTGQILSIFLRGALGLRGRKRARRARRFITGNRGFLSASTLLGAAGVAWGIYDSMKSQGASGASGAWGASGASGAPVPPPIPTVNPDGASAGTPGSTEMMPTEVLRLVRLAVSAARADGTLTAQERELVLEHAREAGIESVVEQELAATRPLASIVSGVTDQQAKRELYVLAFSIIRADESVSGAERVYLAQLAHQLGLDAATVAGLEKDTAASIDATPDQDTDQ